VNLPGPVTSCSVELPAKPRGGELSRRLEHAELTGEPEWIKSSFVVGLKHLPIRYRLS